MLYIHRYNHNVGEALFGGFFLLNGIRVPDTMVFFAHPNKQKIFEHFSFPFVVKPNSGFCISKMTATLVTRIRNALFEKIMSFSLAEMVVLMILMFVVIILMVQKKSILNQQLIDRINRITREHLSGASMKDPGEYVNLLHFCCYMRFIMNSVVFDNQYKCCKAGGT